MPSAADLPPDLERLPRYNAIELRDPGWGYGVGRLVDVLDDRVGRPIRRFFWTKVVAPAVAVAALALAIFLWVRDDDSPSASPGVVTTVAVGPAPTSPAPSTTLSIQKRQEIASHDQQADPYFGHLTKTATQEFDADTNRITYVAVKVGVGGAENTQVRGTMRIDLCADASCNEPLATATPDIVNYGLTVAAFDDIVVTPEKHYYVRWHRPDSSHISPNPTREGEQLFWDTYWSGGSTGTPGPREIVDAENFFLVVKGYNA